MLTPDSNEPLHSSVSFPGEVSHTGAPDLDVLSGLLFTEDSGSLALDELEAFVRCRPGVVHSGAVFAALLTHSDPAVRLSAAERCCELPLDQVDPMPVLLAAFVREEDQSAPGATSASMTGMRCLMKDYSYRRLSTLEDIRVRFERSSKYAREQNMTSFAASGAVPTHVFDWIAVGLMDSDRLMRGLAAEALNKNIPEMSVKQRQTALLCAAYGLKDPQFEDGLALYKSRLLDVVGRLPDLAAAVKPLVGTLFDCGNPILRTEAAITSFLLSHTDEDSMVEIVVTSLKERGLLQEKPRPIPPIKESTEASIQVEAAYWAQVAVGLYVEKHFNVHMPTWPLDQARENFVRTLDQICDRFHSSMVKLEADTADKLSALYRGVLVGRVGYSLYRLKSESQETILNELCLIALNEGEDDQVREKALSSISLATIDGSPVVAPLLRVALGKGSASVRAGAFKAAGSIKQINAESSLMLQTVIERFGVVDEEPEVREAARAAGKILNEHLEDGLAG